MGLFHRLQTLLAANFNDLLDQAENPEKLLRQAVRELETAQGRLLDAAARAIAHERLLARQHQACGERVNAAQARAAAAARRGDDAAALAELRLKADQQRDQAALSEQQRRAAETSARLRAQASALRTKLGEARGRLEDLTSRHRATKARRAAAACSAHDPRVHDRFERWAAQVEREEAETEALFELLGEPAHDRGDDAALAAELQALKEQCHVAG